MRRGRRSARVIIVAAVAILAPGAGLPAAGAVPVRAAAHSTPGWRLVKTLGPCESLLFAITATGPRDAWTTGFQYCPRVGPLIARWNGRSWQELRPPRSFAGDKEQAVAALSLQYAWTFADNGSEGSALLWQHGRAHAYGLPGASIVSLAAAFSQSDAWGFGTGDITSTSPTFFATRWNGRAWLKETVPVLPEGLAAPGPRNIWVLGALPSQGAQSFQPNALAHWTGRWQTIPFPHLPSGIVIDHASVVAGSSAGAWVLAEVFTSSSPRSRSSVLLHWTGSRWIRITVPYQTEDTGPVAHDGHGGLWMVSNLPTCPRCTGVDMIHYSAARTWTKAFVHVPNEFVGIEAMRLIPGTRSLWAAGSLGPPEELAAIFKYGP